MKDKKGQSWTIDYMISILFFVIGLGVALALIGDAFEERTYEQLLQDATRISHALINNGYPQYFDEQDLVRIGLLSDARISWRKTELITNLNEEALRTTLPTAYNYAFTITKNQTIIPINNHCSIGTTTLPQTTNNNQTNYTIAYYHNEGTLITFMNELGASIYEEEQLSTLLRRNHRYDIIVLENPRFNERTNTTFTLQDLQQALEQTTAYTKKLLFIGAVNTPFLGATLLEPTPMSSQVQLHNDQYYDLIENTTISYEEGRTITFSQASKEEHISEGTAKWQHKDSVVYYFSQTNALYHTSSLQEKIEEGIRQAHKKADISCEAVHPENILTPDLVKIERVVADRGSIATITLYAWRTP